MEKKKKSTVRKEKKIVGTLSSRGRTFRGIVVKKFPHRVVVELERTVKEKKYERLSKKKTRLHARLPAEMKVKEGDAVRVRETRPLSKIVHFIVIEVLGGKEE
ncbi:30S ribosomal protein S17 [Candidatus Pacearchaeota archaeon CG10_big_fil_rev_8_21_14_0_10_35_219]|nr:30S ribosomal protein S17 [Candidatus Pacearchaeota archaeon]OIO42313.1 MAG: 30S ribosomal protein S17 [Candidatus Pacearchaeota archaeon CG1_02_35_32]PIO07453.1 MAG: 30S ribosomal protein S17 [Candidatus Pacearchaeota archaeon CG10_big_fil_rev_8_21_14_0_10_35_219]PIY81259.1 MAG: 30S ribosomal protein S17 [Candidatus Pacearchaeota archaeon CG_4_10_14_0_8_um_filter_35_169]PIZ80188.1 MAG: 30S ribosomal protein S17 [Candidatus Pacearchaeota archaeon CG_4_10_14_0_2_um_filter_35_33]PJA69547.1 MA